MNILRILAWKNLKRNKKRTIATIIGISGINKFYTYINI